MSSAAKVGLVDLVGQLTSLDVSLEGRDEHELLELLEERQRILTKIQNADASTLDPETRRSLWEQVRSVRERDLKLLSVLEARRDEGLKRRQELLNARDAVRGYRPPADAAERGPDRIA